MDNKRKRMEELVAYLNEAGRVYYQESNEIISNQELWRKLCKEQDIVLLSEQMTLEKE